MKKILSVILLLLLYQASAYSQQFRVSYQAGMTTTNDRQEPCGNQSRIEVFTSMKPGVSTVPSSTSSNFTDYLPESIDEEKWWNPAGRTLVFEGVNPVSKIEIFGYHWDDPTWGGCKERGRNKSSVNISDTDYPCFSTTLHGFYGTQGGSSYLNIKIEPVSGTTPLKYITDSAFMFPSDDRVTIQSNVPYNAYQWSYRINTGAYLNNDSRFGSTQAIVLSAKELFGNNYMSQVNKNITFRARYLCNNAYTDIYTLPVRLSSPHIVSSSYDMETCNETNDAKLRIKFDRPLYTGETLYIGWDNRFTEDDGIPVTIDPVTLEAVLPGMSAGTYIISLLGKYQNSNHPDALATYTDGVNHQDTITIAPRPKVELTVLGQDSVTCKTGSDGKIRLKAIGGTGKYIASIYNVNDQTNLLDSIRLEEGVENAFTNLPTGNYTIHLKDTNNCIPPINAVQSIQVLEAALAVQMYRVSSQEPTGYGRSNGWAQVSIKGGTQAYHAVWTDAQGAFVASNPLFTQDGEIVSKAEGLRTGWYHVRIEDSNYPLAYPATESNRCGCMDTLSIFIDQPPMLLVDISERHYVTCHGDNDGVIVAHAKGGRPHTGGLPYTYQWTKVSSTGASEQVYTVNDSILTGLSSGFYTVNIMDRNSIDTTSAIFHLVQPEPLVVQAVSRQNLLCDGDNIGKAEVIVTGGTPPYTYYWQTGDTTKLVTGLSRNIYSVFVRDARYLDNPLHYCSAESSVEISSPNGLNISADIKEPTCNDFTDGSIGLTLTGGRSPYTYLWSDGNTGRDRMNLRQGIYSVQVTDANGCSLTKEYNLEQPAPIRVNLGEDFTLCQDQSITVDADIGVPGISYAWLNSGGNILATTPAYTISQAGTYKLIATSALGCVGEDQLVVHQSNEKVNADFVIASQVANNSKMYAVNIIRTPVDSIEWIVPDNATVYERSKDRVQFSFSGNGYYTIGLAAYKGLCKDILYKTVEVVNQADIEEDAGAEPFLKRFIVFPNPNDGNFEVLVELREPANYELSLYTGSGNIIKTEKIVNKMSETTRFSENGRSPGTYYLRLVSKEITSVFKIIIK